MLWQWVELVDCPWPTSLAYPVAWQQENLPTYPLVWGSLNPTINNYIPSFLWRLLWTPHLKQGRERWPSPCQLEVSSFLKDHHYSHSLEGEKQTMKGVEEKGRQTLSTQTSRQWMSKIIAPPIIHCLRSLFKILVQVSYHGTGPTPPTRNFMFTEANGEGHTQNAGNVWMPI